MTRFKDGDRADQSGPEPVSERQADLVTDKSCATNTVLNASNPAAPGNGKRVRCGDPSWLTTKCVVLARPVGLWGGDQLRP